MPAYPANRIVIAILAALIFSGMEPAIAPAVGRVVPKSKHPLDPFLKIAQQCRRSLQKVSDYTAIFRKLEVVRGKPHRATMSMKFRQQPFSVYLYFLDAHPGRQVLYVNGQYDGKIVARQPTIGRLGVTISVDPKSKRAMSEGRHPITRIGVAKMIDGVIEQWQSERRYDDIQVTYYPNATLKRREARYRPMQCRVLETSHKRPHKGTFFMTRVYVEKKSNLPVRVEQYGYPPRPGVPPPLLEEYTYWNLRTNVGLRNADFDRRNPKYRF